MTDATVCRLLSNLPLQDADKAILKERILAVAPEVRIKYFKRELAERNLKFGDRT